MDGATYTAFVGDRQLVAGRLPAVLRALKEHHDRGGDAPLVFEDATGRQVDFDLRGPVKDVLARHEPVPARRGPGRPRLGVTGREVTLLPRHWEWLDRQGGGASAALRRLVDDARRRDGGRADVRASAEAAERFLLAIAGDRPHLEEITRALWAGDGARFRKLLAGYPRDVRAHALRLADHAFPQERS